jgi:hypothetical protein
LESFSNERTYNLVVCSHHDSRIGFFDSDLKGPQVDLSQDVFRDDAVVGPAVGFSVVANEVLEASADSSALYTWDLVSRDQTM